MPRTTPQLVRALLETVKESPNASLELIQEAELYLAGEAKEWPEELDNSLLAVIGRPRDSWELFAHEYRKAYNIPVMVEIGDSQYDYVLAFFIHHMVHLWYLHGDGWMDAANEELNNLRTKGTI